MCLLQLLKSFFPFLISLRQNSQDIELAIVKCTALQGSSASYRLSESYSIFWSSGPCMCVLVFAYPFICRYTFKLLPPLVYCEQDYCEHLVGSMACSPVFNSLGYIPLHRVARSQGNLLNSSRSCQIASHRDPPTPGYHQQCMRTPVTTALLRHTAIFKELQLLQFYFLLL